MVIISRRDFMAGAAGATILGGCGGFREPRFWESPGEIRKPRAIRPDEKMNVACIGIGGKGRGDTLAMKTENVVALCDVRINKPGDKPSTELPPGFTEQYDYKQVTKQYPNAKFYRDYRQMLREMDERIDAVTVSTPDHTHFPAAMMAISMGKHVFCQKPLCRTIWETRMLTDAARRHGVATQMGTQRHAEEGIRLLCEWVWAGAIGEVREAHLWTDRPLGRLDFLKWAGASRPTDSPPVPPELDWDLWVGTRPWRPYHPVYEPKYWRAWWEFGTGSLGDMGCHIFDAAFWALKLGYPSSVEAESAPLNGESVPMWSIIRYQFPAREGMPPLKLTWYDGGKMPPRPKELEDGRELPTEDGGQLFVGGKGTIMADAYCKSPRIIPEAKMKEFLPNRPPKTIPRSIGHVQEWVRACKGGEPAGANFDYAGPLTEVVLLGNLAIRAQKKIECDPATRRILNVSERDVLYRPTFREF